jgi:ribose 5-phosphate isomerase B
MRIGIGSDHVGVDLKEMIKRILDSRADQVTDFGTSGTASVDYPDFGRPVAEAVSRGDYDRGILICGTGLGMAITANKIAGVRAVTCGDTFGARNSRLHNDSNVLCLGARITGPGLAEDIVKIWLDTEFEGGRHVPRLEKVAAIEREWCSRQS